MNKCSCGKTVPDWPHGWPDPICPGCVAKRILDQPMELDSGKDARNDAIAGEYESRMARIDGRDR